MQVHEWFGQVLCKARRATRTRHAMPLIANPSGVEYERKFVVRGMRRSSWRTRHEPRTAVGVPETAVLEQPGSPIARTLRDGPLYRL